MTEITSLRPVAAVLVSAVAIVPILASRGRPNVREGWTVLTAVTKLGIVASMVPGVLDGQVYVTELGTFVPGVEFALRADPLGLLFGLLASLLWLVTSFYSIGYMRGLDEHGQTRYFAAFAGSLSAAVGVAFASNLLVLFVFYELLTVATYPLVAHDETAEARAAGRKYLAYTFGGGVAALAGTVLAPLPTLLGGLGATVAWDAGHHARELDRQLGRESPSGAVERRHLGYLLVVGAASVGLTYIGYLSVAGSLGPGSAVLLFVGTVALFVAFGREF